MKITIHPLSNLGDQPPGIKPDERLIKNLETSFRRIMEHEAAFADRFYQGLFAAHPQIRSMFPADMTQQKHKLVDMLALVFENLRSPQVVRSRLCKLGLAHVEYGAQPEHYPLVCRAMLAAMADTDGPNWSADLAADWTSALDLVCDAMLRPNSGTNSGAD